ncbi:MAG TPA: hypothetical protein QGF95_18510 [Candidatus Latescibacteria bacterium]|jgi:hypothetical protein|nr:hypothetical protein [Gemmatimonadaceae bacterium]MDP6017626.1 hypothetical protein [Candidatus Latescibacterota bacterium]HJP32541.1 hypothetical protein [Candidatus Latescibacterota bacterium]
MGHRNNKTHIIAALMAMTLALTAGACGELDRNNLVDPVVSGGLTLRDQLLGSWSRADDEKNEIYTFTADGRIELRDFTSPAGGTIDRNATFPTTRVRVLAGTYTLVGNLLTIFFTQAQSNDPDDTVQVPSAQKVVEISIRRATLTFKESDGTRFYTSL